MSAAAACGARERDLATFLQYAFRRPVRDPTPTGESSCAPASLRPDLTGEGNDNREDILRRGAEDKHADEMSKRTSTQTKKNEEGDKATSTLTHTSLPQVAAA
jgi:hypothetical protein